MSVGVSEMLPWAESMGYVLRCGRKCALLRGGPGGVGGGFIRLYCSILQGYSAFIKKKV